MADSPRFELKEIVRETRVARAGVKVGDVFEECVAKRVPGIPFCNERDEIVGRVSIRHTLKMTCVPAHLVKGADLLGDAIEAVRIPETLARQVLEMPAERFVIAPKVTMTSAAPMVKALAVMERHNSSYAFVVDDGVYKGTVTRMWIASLMLDLRDR